METNQRIATILNALDYTPATLAEPLGISPRRAKKILNGTATIRCGLFFEICQLTGISPNALIGRR